MDGLDTTVWADVTVVVHQIRVTERTGIVKVVAISVGLDTTAVMVSLNTNVFFNIWTAWKNVI